VTCPICKKIVDESTIGKPGNTAPFCSDRCKLVDLGRWLNGAYQIEAVDKDDETDESELGTWESDKSKKKKR
jgi:uncharacterized protein